MWMIPLVQAQIFQGGLAFQDVLVHQAPPAVMVGEKKQWIFLKVSMTITQRKHLCNNLNLIPLKFY